MILMVVFFLMIRRPPRSTQSRSSAASDVYKRQLLADNIVKGKMKVDDPISKYLPASVKVPTYKGGGLSLIHISEPTRPY